MPIRLSGLNSGMDTESIIKDLVSAKKIKVDTMKKEQTKLSWKQDAWKALNAKIYNLYTDTISNMRFDTTFIKKKTQVSDSNVLSVLAGANAADGVQTAHVESMAKAAYLTGGKVQSASGDAVKGNTKLVDLGIAEGETISFTSKGKQIDIAVTDTMTMTDFTSKLKEAGVNANFDEANQRLFISAKSTGVENDFSFAGSEDVLSKLGLSENATGDQKATKIAAENSVMILNGVRYESASNTMTVNGSTFEIKGVSAKDENGNYKDATITTSDDYDSVYDTIKGFIKKYNELINEITKMYNADSSKDYLPLTSEEKEEMTDDEISQWETKIKDSLLRRDSSLGSIMNVLTSTMAEGVEINGKKQYLSDFGIATQGYMKSEKNEQNAYHIDGDKEDSATSGVADKLKAALASNGEGVVKFFTELGNNLYKNMTTAMDRVEGFKSKYKVYNDKQMADELAAYKTKISDAEEKLTAYEDKWYAKFAAMEKALASMSSKQSAVSSLFSS